MDAEADLSRSDCVEHMALCWFYHTAADVRTSTKSFSESGNLNKVILGIVP